MSCFEDHIIEIIRYYFRLSFYRCSEKRVSAVAISSDGSYVCFADKFGVVWVVDVDVDVADGNQASVSKKAAPLLSHYCSIITSLVIYFLLLGIYLFLTLT